METSLSNSTAERIDSLWQHLESYTPTSDAVIKYRDQWRAIADVPTVRTVIFGAYDAGKSSLLKRLLVDRGISVPDWVVISARRETFESGEVQAGSITFIDTPGLGSGNDEHDATSRATLQLADAFIWVLPPQLVTSGQSDYVSLLNGTFFHPQLPSSAVAAATIAVISRMDEAGVDPSDSQEGYEKLADKKTMELVSMLSKDKLSASAVGIHCVVADPYQMVGNTPNPDRSMYDLGRSWDGVDALMATLDGLEHDKLRLRQLAGLRFVYAVARELGEAVRAESDMLHLRAERLNSDSQRFELFRQRLANLTSHSDMDLQGRIEEALRPTAQAELVDIPRVMEQLESSLSETIDLWARTSCAALQSLAQEFELEIQQACIRLDMSGLLDNAHFQVDTPKDGSPESSSFSRNRKRIFGFMPVIAQTIKNLAESDLGMSMQDAARKLGELEGLTGDALTEAIKKIFKSKEQMEKASSYVRWTASITVIAPLATQLASVGSDILEEHLNQKQIEVAIEKRKLIQEKLDEQVVVVRERASRLFRELSQNLDQQLLTRWQASVDEKLRLLDQRQQSEDFLKRLQILLN